MFIRVPIKFVAIFLYTSIVVGFIWGLVTRNFQTVLESLEVAGLCAVALYLNKRSRSKKG